jgi:hypothetical protein
MENVDISGTFELDGARVTFKITGTGSEDYEVTTRGVARFEKACQVVESMITALAS